MFKYNAHLNCRFSMKKSFLLVSIIIFLGAVNYNCSSPHKKLFKQLAAEQDRSRYPNDDSELALLMRAMDKDMRLLKKAVVNQSELPQLLKKFKAIHVATPTDAEVKTPQFTVLAQLMVNNTEKIYKAKHKKKAYNLLVNNCIACHQSYCPGPVVRIKKLKISE